MPFLKQVELFSETMNERFIEPRQSGICLIVLAMDLQEDVIEYVNTLCGDDFDLAFCVSQAMRKKEFKRLYENAIEVKNIIEKYRDKKRP